MILASVMKHPVHSVRPLDSIAHARAVMEEYRINQLPVTKGGRLVGIVTDRDLRDAFPSVFEHRPGVPHDPSGVPVEAVMTTNVLTLAPDQSVAAAARLMRRERIGAVPLVAGDRLVGIVTRSDLLDVLASDRADEPIAAAR